MNELLADLVAQGQTGISAGFVVFLRIGAAMAVLPALGRVGSRYLSPWPLPPSSRLPSPTGSHL